MSTTVVRDSIVGDAWIQQTAASVPIQKVIDQETGQPTGDLLTGPVRLAFDTLFELPQPTAQMQNPKYGAAILFTPYADFSLIYEEYYNICAQNFADRYDAATQQYYGLHSPFRDQAEKAKFGGFTPGCVFMTVTSKYKPPVVDARGNPIVDPSKVYPGVWAICGINAYANLPDRQNPAKKIGVGFGLQSVMIIGDDTKFGGGAPDANKMFAAAKGAIQAPAIQPGQVAGNMPAGSQPPADPSTPPAPAGGTYAAPPAGHSPAPASSTATPPHAAPGQANPATASPSNGAMYQMPGQPAPAPAAADPRGPVPAGYGSWAEYDADMNSL